MLFNVDPSKQPTEVYFSQRHGPTPDLPLTFNKNTIQIHAVQKYIRPFLDSKLKDTINHLELFVEKCQFFNQNNQ